MGMTVIVEIKAMAMNKPYSNVFIKIDTLKRIHILSNENSIFI